MNFTAREIAEGDIFGITNANTTALTTQTDFTKQQKFVVIRLLPK